MTGYNAFVATGLLRADKDTAINILIGYGYHPTTTATYMQRALEGRATTTFIGTPWAARSGFPATGDIGAIVAGLPARPDLYLYVDSGAAWYFPRGLTQLECPTACYLIDVHVGPKVRLKQAFFFDYVFTAQRDFVTTLRRAGHPHAYWLPLACDPEVHRRYPTEKRYDIGFVGTTGGGYVRRKTLLERLARRYTISDFSRSYTPAEMARVYSESRLVFNCSLRHEVNMRVFEGPATGSLLLTDRIGNGLQELVTDREHVVMYDDDNLLDIADEFLTDNTAREQIALKGYEHVRTKHTYNHRITALLDTVLGNQGTPQRLAPLRRASNADIDVAYAEMYSLVGRVDDTIAQLKTAPPEWRYRIPITTHIATCLLRRIKYG